MPANRPVLDSGELYGPSRPEQVGMVALDRQVACSAFLELAGRTYISTRQLGRSASGRNHPPLVWLASGPGGRPPSRLQRSAEAVEVRRESGASMALAALLRHTHRPTH